MTFTGPLAFIPAPLVLRERLTESMRGGVVGPVLGGDSLVLGVAEALGPSQISCPLCVHH